MNYGLETSNPATPGVLAFDPTTDRGIPLTPRSLGRRESLRLADSGDAAPGTRRVLLLDDDPSFREIIQDFLTENGYTVTAVQSGVEGVREVLAGDFSAILCDMMMPALPGDMFFRAVERSRPHLCERFVFMTGHRNDGRANDFIRSVTGFVLRKPFHLNDLMDSIALAEVRGTYRSVFESEATDLVHSPADRFATGEISHPPAFEVAPEMAAPPAARARVDTAPHRPPIVLWESEPQPRARVVSQGFAFSGMALFASFAVIFGIRYPGALDRAAIASAERLALEAEWKLVSAQAKQMETSRPGLLSLREQAKRIAEERKAGGWTGALRAVSTTAGREIELRNLTARGIAGVPGTCELRIEGVAVGDAPRAVADGFHRALRRELERSFRGPIQAGFEKLEDEPVPSSAPSERRRASFAFPVKLELNNSPKTESGVTK